MPVEIFELVIKATVNGKSNTMSSTDNSKDSPRQKMPSKQEVDAQILEILNRKKER